MNITLTPGNFDHYTKIAYSMPMLSEDEEINLSNRYKNQNDLIAAHELVMAHLKYVFSIAKKYMGYGLPHDELVQEGSIGLMKAVKSFDTSFGVRLSYYASYFINSEIQEYVIKNWRLVKIATTKAQRKLFFNLRSMKTNFDTLSQQEICKIAKTLNVEEHDVKTMETRFNNNEISMSIDENDEETLKNPIFFMADDSSYEPQNILYNSDNISNLNKAIDMLDDRSKKIIKSRWLCDEEDKITFQELSTEFGISIERVRQIEKASFDKIKKFLL